MTDLKRIAHLLEGLVVSVDVSTGDHNSGNRYFGTVTEVMECEGEPLGVVLLVQDAQPNFKPGGGDSAKGQEES